MFSTEPGLDAQAAVQNGYILVDWSTAFMINHSRALPGLPAPGMRVSHGRMALDLLQRAGGSAYLAKQQAAEIVADGLLHPVTGASVTDRLGYAVYRPDAAHRELLRAMLNSTRNQG